MTSITGPQEAPHEEALVRIEALSKTFPVRKGALAKITGGVRAVDGVTLEVLRGEIFGLVGESGCGKTTLGRMILRLIEPSGGRVFFDGTEITSLDRGGMRLYRKRMQMVFQDPFSSLNPRKTVASIVGEPLRIAGVPRAVVRSKVAHILSTVGLSPESESRYPHEFSGGQRQRIGIARALILQPDFLLADEPVSALDVSIQAQILNLLVDLKDKFSLTMLFISHDLRVIRSLCDRVAVMYLGRVVETGPAREIHENPFHPYTEVLINSIPEADPGREKRIQPPRGEVPSPSDPPSGCHFHPRCPLMVERCTREVPKLTGRGGRRSSACHVR